MSCFSTMNRTRKNGFKLQQERFMLAIRKTNNDGLNTVIYCQARLGVLHQWKFLRTGYLARKGLCTTHRALGGDRFYFPSFYPSYVHTHIMHPMHIHV